VKNLTHNIVVVISDVLLPNMKVCKNILESTKKEGICRWCSFFFFTTFEENLLLRVANIHNFYFDGLGFLADK
jgi:hypothetical protein